MTRPLEPPARSPAPGRACHVILFTDGAARGNPGPAAIGIVLTDSTGKELEALGEAIGEATNNEAEYRALLRGLELAHAHHASSVTVRTDSELLARQLSGAYRVKAENLKSLYAATQTSLRQFASSMIHHIPRERNRRADSLANQALDQQKRNR